MFIDKASFGTKPGQPILNTEQRTDAVRFSENWSQVVQRASGL